MAVRMRATMKLLLAVCLLAWDAGTSALDVFWNVPTEECVPKIKFDLAKFGITQNTGGSFGGDKFNIIYHPGLFPQVLKTKEKTANGTVVDKLEPVNGGIPQRGNLQKHLARLRIDIEKRIPKDYKGPAVLDFEQWQTTLRSTGETMYRGFSKSHHRSLVKLRHIPGPPRRGSGAAVYNHTSDALFERAARPYLEKTLQLARKLRPNALWGYYHYPYCKAYIPHVTRCARPISEDNTKSKWLYENSAALYPSVYFKKFNYTSWEKHLETRSRLDEADRMADAVGGRPIYPYTWFAYHERHQDFLSPADLLASFGQAMTRRPAGIIIWGGSDNVNSTEKCVRLHDFVESRLGPFVQYMQSLTDAQLEALGRRLQASSESFYSQVELLSRQGAFGEWPVNGWPDDTEDTEEMKRSKKDIAEMELMPLESSVRYEVDPLWM